MKDDHNNYSSPLSSRYASAAMRKNFSPQKKFSTWRRLWVALAECEQELGLDIEDDQLDELRAHVDDVDFEAAAKYERELRHDVMAHIHAWGDQCPTARGIVHLGATSCYVTDNAELIVMRDGLRLLRAQLVNVARNLRELSHKWRHLPVLGLTHYQPAQATTMGKRFALYLQDVLFNLEDLEHAEQAIRFRGVKGTTGSQASFMELFNGDQSKVRALDLAVSERMGFAKRFAVTGQTYPRQLDYRVLQVLSCIAQSAAKFATDLRLAAGKREVEEPFEEKQIGSSAMPWKRNPMRSERICALARHVMLGVGNCAHTAANQWFERTLDDSANRRISVAEAFLATDAILQLFMNISAGTVVHSAVIGQHLSEELPFLATEHLMMEAVKGGADRQDAHERIRILAREASAALFRGEPNPMRSLLEADELFAPMSNRLDELLDPARFVGRAPEQVEEFLSEEVDPLLARYESIGTQGGDIRV